MHRIMIVCNQATRRSLELTLQGSEEIQVVDYVTNGWEALRLCSQTEIDLILMVLIDDFEPIHWIRVINTKFPKVKTLIMIETFRMDVLFEALKNGAAGYMLITDNRDRLVSAINLCLLGYFTTEQVCMKSLLPLINTGAQP